jgi:hypothetical protein
VAVELFAAADALRQQIGAPITTSERRELDDELTDLHAALGGPAFDEAWAEGRAMSEAAAVAIASERS